MICLVNTLQSKEIYTYVKSESSSNPIDIICITKSFDLEVQLGPLYHCQTWSEPPLSTRKDLTVSPIVLEAAGPAGLATRGKPACAPFSLIGHTI